MAGKITISVPNPLRAALTGPRKIQRDDAIRQAEENVERGREEFMIALAGEIQRLCALVDRTAGRRPGAVANQATVLAPVIYNLAGTLGYETLKSVAASLYDVLEAMSDRGVFCLDPVIVHVNAMRLLAPAMPPIPEAASRHIVSELHRVVEHLRASADPCARGCAQCPLLTSDPVTGSA